MDQEYPDFMADVGAMAMGSTTYEWIADYTGFLDDPSKWEYTIPTWVFSSRELPGSTVWTSASSPVTSGRCTRRWSRRPAGKNVWLVGGGELVGQFHDSGLLDEVILGVAPVFLGAGAPLLPRRITHPTCG